VQAAYLPEFVKSKIKDMKIEYENKFSDIFVFNGFNQFESTVTQGLYVLICFLFFKSLLDDNSVPEALVITGVVYVLMWLTNFAFNALHLCSKKDKSTYTKHVVEVQDEFLLDQTQYSKSYFYWNGIVKAVRRPGYVAIFVTNHTACIIPTRAFSSKEQCGELMKLINQKLK
jgi:hypothetical protein